MELLEQNHDSGHVGFELNKINDPMIKKKGANYLGRNKKWIIPAIALLLIASALYFGNRGKEDQAEAPQLPKEVQIKVINPSEQDVNVLRLSGLIEPKIKMDVIAMSRGTVRSLNFDIGDELVSGQFMVGLSNEVSMSSYLNSQTNFTNMNSNLESVKRSIRETENQAEIAVKNANENISAARIAYEAAVENYNNSLDLQKIRNDGLKQNAVSSYYGYMNTANMILDQVNYLIGVDDNGSLEGIGYTLSVKDSSALNLAKTYYYTARTKQKKYSYDQAQVNNIETLISNVLDLLSDTKIALDQSIKVLDNTVASAYFSEANLNAKKANYANLRSTLAGTIVQAEATRNSLENIKPSNKKELDALNSAKEAARVQLEMAKVAYDNAQSGLKRVKDGGEQQVLGARISVDNAQGQLNLSGAQLSDLTITAPIKGKIISRSIDLGQEVAPGQKIAEIAQTEDLQVQTSLNSEDIYRVSIGTKVKINEDYSGIITEIKPVADPLTKKVGVSIDLENEDDKIIIGTFVDVEIPVEGLKKSSEESVFVPLSSVILAQNESYVFVAIQNDDQGKKWIAKKRIIQTGKSEGVLIEITNGLNKDDHLITEGAKRLDDGEMIEIIKP